jgi:hypothetical protein
VWDYFLIQGWVALVKVSTFILSSHRLMLKQMPFEDILPEINEIAADVLTHSRTDLLYRQIKHEFKGLSIAYHIGKLGAEFEESHREVKL